MNITYVHQYFKTPEQGGPLRSFHIAKALVEAGHDVHVITSHNLPETTTRIAKGIKVTYLPVAYEMQFSSIKRIIAFYKFYILATKFILKNSSDLLFITSTPLTTGLIGLKVKSKTQTPYIFEIRDLWPKVPVSLGYFKSKWIIYQLYKLEKKIYRGANHIIGLSPVTTNYIKDLGHEHKYSCIPNMSNCDTLPIYSKNSSSLTVGYFGSFGVSNHLEYLLEAAILSFKNNLNINFILAGSGTEYERLKNEYCSPNIYFKGHLNHGKLHELYQEVDATYTSFLNDKSLEGNSPNKFFESLAKGKITIVNTKGWLKQLVEKNACGFYHSPNNPHEFLEKINSYLNDKNLLLEQQKNARKLAESEFDKNRLTKKTVELISSQGDNESC